MFCATRAEEKLCRENIQVEENANRTHYEVGVKVWKTIKEIGRHNSGRFAYSPKDHTADRK